MMAYDLKHYSRKILISPTDDFLLQYQINGVFTWGFALHMCNPGPYIKKSNN